MPELRKDPIVNRWVIISTERAKRPMDFATTKPQAQEQPCPFCEGHEGQTPPEITAIRRSGSHANAPGWEVRVVPSIAPILTIEGQLNRRGKGMYDLMDGVGAHEIVIETPRHVPSLVDLSDDQVTKILTMHVERMKDLAKDQRFKYALMFKNHGVLAGAGIIRHCRSQLIALPVNPKRVKDELIGARFYFEYKDRCIFCDVVKQELESQRRVVADLDGFVAITPFASRFPFEIYILPKTHASDFITILPHEIGGLAKVLRLTLTKLSRALNDPPYNLTLHTAPFRRPKAGYWRTIEHDYHWHIEIMPRLTRVAGFEWGTGFYINPTPPEEAAKYLKEVEV